MPSLSHTLRMRQRQTARRNSGGKFGFGCSLLASGIILLLSLLAVIAYTEATRALPSVEALPALLEPPDGRYLQPTRLYDRSGQHLILVLEHPAAADRRYLEIAPADQDGAQPYEPLVSATLAAADPYFWRHPGVSIPGLAMGERATLAQRLAVDILLQDEAPGLRRSLRTRLLAIQITARFGREKVLEWYLNSAYYGRLAYGADAAALVYFGKSAADLSLAEAAVLAAAGESPDLNPIEAPQAVIENQRIVIQDMLRHRLATPEQGIQAVREELVFRDADRQGQALQISELNPKVAPAFARLVVTQLETQIKRSTLERGGLRVITTLDYDLQAQASCTLQFQLERLGVESSKALPEDPAESCDAARLLPTEAVQATFPPLTADIVVLDPQTGQVVALTGDPPVGPHTPPLPDRPSGALLTPYIYLTAFTRGLSPASLVWDIPFPEPEDAVQNFDNQFHGPMRLRIALANDYLVPAQKTLLLAGPENVLRTLKQFNLALPSATPTFQNTVLDFIAETNLLNASQAFGVFANQGILAGVALEEPRGPSSPAPLEPVAILRVERVDGEVLFRWDTPQTRPIITPQLAYLMTHTLSDETARWPSLGHPNPLEIGRPTAAKLSRSLSGDSHWSLGYTPQLVVGTWLGFENTDLILTEEQNLVLQEAVAGLWHAVIQYASRSMPATVWEAPTGINFIDVCDPSGLLPTASCPNVVREVFLPGNEPIQEDRLYRLVQIDAQTGRLATVFTPLDRIEERVYMIPPAEAQEWAVEQGLAIPPTSYDTLPIRNSAWPDTKINQPSMFAVVRGQIPIAGEAGGEDFVFYRLQIGEGLNPGEWVQIGEDVYQPTSGQFMLWDTRGLEGLYTIQLLVVRQDQSVERTNVMVTVDNTAPEVRIVAPVNGAALTPVEGQDIILRVQAGDELGVHSLTFYLDNKLLATLNYPPYAVSWPPQTAQPMT